MKTQKILSLILAAAVMCSFVGCQADKGEVTETSQNITTEKAETESKKSNSDRKEINYITDWSIEELVKNVELYGKTYSMPFTLEDLGEDYSIGNKYDFGYDLYYKGENISLIKFDDNDEDLKKCNIINLVFDDNTNIKIEEFYCGNTRKSIEKKYGTPSIESKSKNVCTYVFERKKGNAALLLVYENDKITGITIDGIYEEE